MLLFHFNEMRFSVAASILFGIIAAGIPLILAYPENLPTPESQIPNLKPPIQVSRDNIVESFFQKLDEIPDKVLVPQYQFVFEVKALLGLKMGSIVGSIKVLMKPLNDINEIFQRFKIWCSLYRKIDKLSENMRSSNLESIKTEDFINGDESILGLFVKISHSHISDSDRSLQELISVFNQQMHGRESVLTVDQLELIRILILKDGILISRNNLAKTIFRFFRHELDADLNSDLVYIKLADIYGDAVGPAKKERFNNFLFRTEKLINGVFDLVEILIFPQLKKAIFMHLIMDYAQEWEKFHRKNIERKKCLERRGFLFDFQSHSFDYMPLESWKSFDAFALKDQCVMFSGINFIVYLNRRNMTDNQSIKRLFTKVISRTYDIVGMDKDVRAYIWAIDDFYEAFFRNSREILLIKEAVGYFKFILNSDAPSWHEGKLVYDLLRSHFNNHYKTAVLSHDNNNLDGFTVKNDRESLEIFCRGLIIYAEQVHKYVRG